MKKRGEKKSKKVELELPPWKRKVHEFNEVGLRYLHDFVKKLIPWLVLLLLLIVAGEFGHDINHFIHNMGFHEWGFLNKFGDFVHHYKGEVLMLDNMIIVFFVIDLYFNFFKSPTFQDFLKHNFIDILAVIPAGIIISEGAKLSTEAQQLTHVAADSEKMVGRGLKAAKSTRIVRLLSRIPRFFRVLRLRDFFRKK